MISRIFGFFYRHHRRIVRVHLQDKKRECVSSEPFETSVRAKRCGSDVRRRDERDRGSLVGRLSSRLSSLFYLLLFSRFVLSLSFVLLCIAHYAPFSGHVCLFAEPTNLRFGRDFTETSKRIETRELSTRSKERDNVLELCSLDETFISTIKKRIRQYVENIIRFTQRIVVSKYLILRLCKVPEIFFFRKEDNLKFHPKYLGERRKRKKKRRKKKEREKRQCPERYILSR